jgi:glycosyltransferase involved in cell wall biosynthesis
MKKAAVILSHSGLAHVSTGVRAIALQMYESFKNKGYEVDVLLQDIGIKTKIYQSQNKITGAALHLDFYKLEFNEDAWEQNLHISDKLHSDNFFDKFKKHKFSTEKSVIYTKTAVGISKYDILCYSGPWDFVPSCEIFGKEIFVVWHDYYLNMELFAHVKAVSSKVFKMYSQVHKSIIEQVHLGVKFLCVSGEAKRQLNLVYPNAQAEVLPPSVLGIFVKTKPVEVKENAVVLANIFDARKGWEYALEVLSKCKNVDKIYIFGSRRCSRAVYLHIIKQAKKCAKEVIHYDHLSTKTLTEIYARSKLLLFPSTNEGLGVPIIEAQMCGTRVMVRKISPMQDLVLDKTDLITEDSKLDAEHIDAIMRSSYNGLEVKKQALERFSDNFTNSPR